MRDEFWNLKMFNQFMLDQERMEYHNETEVVSS